VIRGRWFPKNVFEMRNGCNTLFLHESWLGGNMLNDHLNKLLNTAVDKQNICEGYGE